MMEKKFFTFCPDKNLQLKSERGVSFEEVISAIANGELLDILEHPNKEKYQHQRIYVVRVKDYVYLVPWVTEQTGNIFLKTIIPSRKAYKKYINIKGGQDEKESRCS